ncbi:tetratricopeptide repeat protein [Hwanghaeella grinnelliae]|uniref:tetratricopeptide repeat protein n=1 Tax=Hwanghaeella grinnelliae TaxID=2500179 RepID=UPI0013869BDC|nr:tetratricopeptide repeat protein [Hwanghaeella grinnelliae]
MSEIFREIDEELRQDKLKEQWAKYGRYVVVVAVLVVGGVGGYKGWQYYELQQREKAAAMYAEAIDLAGQKNLSEAAARLGQLADVGGTGYRIVGTLQQAALLVQAGDHQNAAVIYEKLAADTSIPEYYQELALILMAMQQADDADPQALIDRISPLAADGKPWRNTARELMASLYLRLNDTGAARKELAAVADDLDAPATARARAAELLQTLPE